MKINIKIILLFILVVVPASVCFPVIFQKGGIDMNFRVLIISLSMISSTLFNFIIGSFSNKERIFLIFFASLISLLSSCVLTYFAVSLLYQDKTWFLWENPHKVFINFIFYSTLTSSIIFTNKIYVKFFK
jgi:hypothetical protein